MVKESSNEPHRQQYLRFEGLGNNTAPLVVRSLANTGGRHLVCSPLLVQETTVGVEMKQEGEDPWKLYDDVEVIFTPGHSEGSVCLLHKTSKVLFTGDHLLKIQNNLSIGEDYNF